MEYKRQTPEVPILGTKQIVAIVGGDHSQLKENLKNYMFTEPANKFSFGIAGKDRKNIITM